MIEKGWAVIFKYENFDENKYGYYVVNAPMDIPDRDDVLAGPFDTSEEAKNAGKRIQAECEGKDVGMKVGSREHKLHDTIHEIRDEIILYLNTERSTTACCVKIFGILEKNGMGLDRCVECKGMKGGVPGNENLVGGKPICDYCSVKLTSKKSGT